MFITLEGIDGCGKSTQSERLSAWLTERTGHGTIRTYEPGGYPSGESLRRFILGSRDFSPMSELLLFLTDRAEHVNKVIAPALEAGHNVICERWNESTLAYQSGGHRLNVEQVKSLIAACDFPEPDVKLFLDVPPEAAFTRIASRKPDKFEEEGLALMRRVSESYRELAESGYLTRIDCEGKNEDEVFAALASEINAWLSR